VAFDYDTALVARNLTAAAKRKGLALDQVTFDNVISDITFVTTLDGASSLEISIIDADLELLTSGFFDADDNFALDAIDLQYPGNSNYWWRLSEVAFDTTSTGPNLTLTFEDRIVSYLRNKRGTKSASRARVTRAEFIKSITADEIKHSPRPIFVSPELRVRQPIATPTPSTG
jgi:hypothetical protein